MSRRFFYIFLVFFFYTPFISYSQCDASFVFNGKQCLGDTLWFDFNGQGQLYEWDFGDINSGSQNLSTDSSTKHIFSDTGLFFVRLIVRDSNNSCVDTLIKSVRIFKLPVASFVIDNPCQSLMTGFTNTSSFDVYDSIKWVSWNFGDSTSSTSYSSQHVYNSFGAKSVKLKIETKEGCIDSTSRTIEIYSKPTTILSDDSVCQSDEVDFDVNTGSHSILSYQWRLGDNTTQNTQNFSHQYSTSGLKTISLEIEYLDGGVCLIDSLSVYVFKQPNAWFSINSLLQQCYKGNEVCLLFGSDTTGIKFRNILWDDGSSESISPSSSSACYKYNNPNGGSYRITQDVIDSNGCASRYTIEDSIKIPKDPKANFLINKTGGCFKSFVSLNNTSNMMPPLIKQFYFDWADGTIDSNNWTNNQHIYSDDGTFNIKLTIVDTFGCADTFISNSSILNTSFIVDARLDKVYDFCRSTNLFGFKQTPIPGASISWFFNDSDSSSQWNPSHRYTRGNIIGQYIPSVRISKNGCDSTLILDTAIVYGPFANANIANRFQCQIKDTVYFNNTTLTYRNQQLKVTWNAGDLNASNCIIDSKNNMNQDSNCNFSIDSLTFKHLYKKGFENCYSARITVEDSVIGCTDFADLILPLMPPDASTGISFNYSSGLCLGPELTKRVTLNLGQTTPNCGREQWWVMWDSTCAAQSGNFDSYWLLNQSVNNYSYMPCNPDGTVSVGIIIQNGSDTLNNICRDTFFYHKIIKFGLLEPRFTSDYNPSIHYCKGTSFNFNLRDSTLDSIVFIRWDFGDGTFETNLSLLNRTHRYVNNGVYKVSVFMRHANGCEGTDTMIVRVGVNGSFSLNKYSVCVGDSVVVSNTSSYFNGASNWINPNRAQIETTLWDIGDGNGFVVASPSVVIKYANIGDYFVKMRYVDSVGCIDTVNISSPIRFFDVFSSMRIPQTTYTCAQVVQFFSTATVYDSLNNFGHSDDNIVKFSWYFNNGTSNSLLKNPFKFFKAGIHDVKLVVQNTIGCKDSISDLFTVIGPTAILKIISDSVGCQPLTVTFKNESINANSYTFRYKNLGNSITNTNTLSNNSFTYTNYGLFYPDLIARNTFNNNGVNVTCADTFPAPNDTIYRLIVDVKEKPIPNFTHSTNCATNTTTFNNTTVFASGNLTKFEWFFGDGDSSHSRNPIHQFSDTGAYRIVLKTYSSFGCIDSVVRIIYISPFPTADFNYNEVCVGNLTQFSDLSNSYNDIINLWSWNFGNATSGNLKNPSITYLKDSLYNVSLMVRNRAGCTNSITKQVNVWARPIPQFDFSNVCHKTAHQFNNTTTSKQNPFYNTWKFDNQGADSNLNTQFVFNDSGNFNVKLVVSTIKGCKDSIVKNVRVFPNPKADFSISTVSYCLNQNRFDFTNNSTINTDSFVSYQWQSIDNISSNLKNFTYHFDSVKNYPIRLISTTNRNCKDTIIKNIQVFPSPFAKGLISAKNECINGDSISFEDVSEVDSLNISRNWIYLNNVISSQKKFNYKFNNLNQHYVMLEVNNLFSCKDSTSDTIVIHPKPIAKIGNSIKEQCYLNHQILLNDSSTVSDNSLLTRKWQFGNGDSSILKNQNYVFAQADTFSVRLISQSAWFCLDTTYSPVVIHPMPIAGFEILNDSQCLRDNFFEFVNQSNIKYQTPLSFHWDFGNLDSSLSNNPTQIYLNHGDFPVKLIATSNFNCKDTVYKNVVVHPMPIADFKFKDSALCFLGHQIETYNTSSIPYTNFQFYWTSDIYKLYNLDTFKIQYLKDSSYWVQLKAISEYGCKDSISKKSFIWPMPIADFKIDTANQCFRNNLFSFSNLSTSKDGNLQYKWYFGDSDSSNNNNPQHQYDNDGFFNVKLISSSINACRDTMSLSINVFPMPNALVWINNPSQCLNTQNFEFRDSSNITNGTLKSQWIWYDAKIDSTKFVNRLFDIDSTLSHQLVSISNQNCADTVSFSITIHSVPIANFSINDTDQCVNVQQYQMTNLSSINKGNLSYVWKFGDTMQSLVINPIHQYSKGGFYDIELMAISENLCKDSLQKTIRVYFKPEVSILTDSAQCLLNNNFNLIGTSSIEEGQLINYFWYKDGNLYSRNKDTSIIYQSQGTYTMMYVLESDFECQDTIVQTLIVHPMPIASFAINDSVQCENNNLFEITSTSSIPYGFKAEKWQFSDGDSDTGAIIRRQYNYSDTIEIQLISESDYFCRDTAYKTIFNQPQPFVSFVINDTNQCQRFNSFMFENKSVIGHGIMDFIWDFGDGNDTNSLNAEHTYLQHQNYFVSLSALSNYDCRDTQTIEVIVYPDPKADFNIDINSQCLRNNVFQLTNLSTIDSSQLFYFWKLGDGFTSVTEDFDYSYQSDGQYPVMLYVNSQYNCKDSISKMVYVNPMPVAKFNVNDTNQCINEQLFVFNNTSTIKYGKIDSTKWWINNLFFNQQNTVNISNYSSGIKNTFLRVVSDSNCTDTFYKLLRVYPKPIADFTINDSVQCIENNAYVFNDFSTDSFGINSINWYIDKQYQTSVNPFLRTFDIAKTYQITLIPVSIYNCRDTINKSIRVKPMPDASFNSLKPFYCNDEPAFQLIPKTPGGLFVGKNVFGDLLLPEILWKDTVSYTVTVDGCTSSSSQNTQIYPFPEIELGNDTLLCKHEAVLLKATNWNSEYYWQDGRKDAEYLAFKPGLYFVTAKNVCGVASDSILLSFRTNNCRLYLPTAFTPGSNGVNDFYKPITFGVDEMFFEIFNRWGEKVFEGDINSLGWDGTYKGELVQDAYFLINVNYTFRTEFKKVAEYEKQVFYLLR
ncbi:MAG: PKD domain-containing protein [Bacteroidota bacterium]|nr:PKD domain-containing protein [Bacteroidota bacterium]